MKTDILAAFTNNTYTGAMRGFGAPQAVFANESLMDEIALELGIDPVDVRRLNGYRQGSVTATGHKLDEHTVSLMEVIDRATEAAGWREKRQRLPLENRGKTIVRGIGMACSFRGCSLGAEGVDATGAIVSVQTDGSVIVSTGLAENGQGLRTIFSQIAAEELGVDIGRIVFLPCDTSGVPDGGPTVASRSTIMGGNAVRDAARKARRALEDAVAQELGVSSEEIEAGFESFPPLETGPSGSASTRRWPWPGTRPDVASFGWHQAPKVNWDEHVGQGKAYFTVVRMPGRGGGRRHRHRPGAGGTAHRCARRGQGGEPQAVQGQFYGGMAMGLGYGLLEGWSSRRAPPAPRTSTNRSPRPWTCRR